MTIGIIEYARQGIREHQRRLDAAAADVGQAATDSPARPALPASGDARPTAPTDLVDAASRLARARHGLAVCLAVGRAGDQLLGTVIDTLA